VNAPNAMMTEEPIAIVFGVVGAIGTPDLSAS
jgi:hypothetical protein